jgi:hypothetical protein
MKAPTAFKGGRATLTYFAKLEAFLKENENDADIAALIPPLKKGYADMGAAAGWLMNNASKNYDHAGAASYDMLNIFGIVTLGWLWARMAKIAHAKLKSGEGNPEFWKRKLILAKYWMERELPNTSSALARIEAGADTLMEMDAANF